MARSYTDAVAWLLRDVVRLALGMAANTVRPANQANPVGPADEEFATLLITSVQASPDPVVREIAVTAQPTLMDFTLDDVQTLQCSVQFFKSRGANSTNGMDTAGLPKYSSVAFDRAVRLPQRLLLPDSIERLFRYGIGFIDASAPKNLTAIVDALYESRGQIDLTFAVVNRETLRISIYDHVPIELRVAWPGGETDTRTLTPGGTS
jgi:hypothetical protein